MLSATFIDLFYIPLLFVVVSQFFKKDKRAAAPGDNTHEPIAPSEGQ
jgi:hypothetical protein